MQNIPNVEEKLLEAFPGGFLNERGEFIAHRNTNQYFALSNCKTEADVKCKVLEWLSRSACKAIPYTQSWRNERLHQFMLDGINRFLGTGFTSDDIAVIYDVLGNAVKHQLTVKFVENGMDVEWLKAAKTSWDSDAIKNRLEAISAAWADHNGTIAIADNVNFDQSHLDCVWYGYSLGTITVDNIEIEVVCNGPTRAVVTKNGVEGHCFYQPHADGRFAKYRHLFNDKTMESATPVVTDSGSYSIQFYDRNWIEYYLPSGEAVMANTRNVLTAFEPDMVFKTLGDALAEKVLPCPFCGSQMQFYREEHINNSGRKVVYQYYMHRDIGESYGSRCILDELNSPFTIGAGDANIFTGYIGEYAFKWNGQLQKGDTE